MPIKRPRGGCPEWIEVKSRVNIGYENKVCGRPIYLNGVCDRCWRMNETLRTGDVFQATGGVAERLNADAYDRLHINTDALHEKGIERDVERAMDGFDKFFANVLGDE